MDGVVDQFINAFIGRRRDRNDGDPQHLFHLVDPDTAAVPAHLIHHVESQYHGNADLHQLHRQIQIALNVRGVHDVNDSPGMFPENKLPRDNLLTAVRGHGVNTRQIRDQRVVTPADHAVFSVYRDAGEIAYMLIGSGELVKERRLAAVLVAGQRESQLCAFRERVFLGGIMIAPPFAKSGMFALDTFALPVFFIVFRLAAFGLAGHVLLILLQLHCLPGDSDLLRVRDPQCEIISVDHQLHGVSHRRIFHYFDDCSGNHSHIKKVLPESAFSAHFGHYGALTDLQIFDCHYALRSSCLCWHSHYRQAGSFCLIGLSIFHFLFNFTYKIPAIRPKMYVLLTS